MKKEREKRVIRRGAIILAVIGFVIFAGECPASPYRPAAAVSIVSEYSAVGGAARPHTQVWKVMPEAGPGGAMLLRFFPEAAADAGSTCEVALPAPGAAGEIRWQGIGKPGKKSSTGLLLLPGFPAPCDILPVGREDSGIVYEERSEAGGRVFSRSYRVSHAAVGVDEARAMGWIRADGPGSPGLIMVAVTDDRGRPVVKQLWPAGGSWWLYEETPLRRSWLIQ